MSLNGKTPCSRECRCAKSHPVASAAAALLDQCASFIRGVPESCYAAESRTLQGGTIGKHIRHTLDHYRAALGACAMDVIDYDHRERDVPMETEPGAALQAIQQLRESIQGLDAHTLAAPVRIRVMVSGDGSEVELGSTLARELAFATHHAVHHHAMLGAIAMELGLTVSEGFGKAPSTVAYEQARG